jgi:hypothetical protein
MYIHNYGSFLPTCVELAHRFANINTFDVAATPQVGA